MDPEQEKALVTLYTLGELSPKAKAAAEELHKRGEINLGTSFTGDANPEMPDNGVNVRQQAMDDLASDVGTFKSFLIGAGQGFTNVGRGLGIAEPANESEKQSMQALHKQNPISTGAGEIVGESAPFIPASIIPGGGLATSAGTKMIPAATSLLSRILSTGALSAIEGGVVAKGREEQVSKGATVGAGVGMTAEILIPIIGKLGRKVFQRVTGRVPTSALIDAAGNPSAELQQALESAGMSFDDLTEDAINVIKQQQPGADAAQATRKAVFEGEGVPITQGELTKDLGQLTEEQRLAQSVSDTAAEPFRQYKLSQSEAIKKRLKNSFGGDPTKEETGGLIKGALEDRLDLTRTQRNDLYTEFSTAAKDLDDLLIFTDGIKEAIPSKAKLRRAERLASRQVNALEDLLVEFGIHDNEYAVKGFLNSGGEITPLSAGNLEDFRVALNNIDKFDRGSPAATIIGDIRRAFDTEVDEMVASANLPDELITTLKKARKLDSGIHVEFSPESFVGKLTGTKGGGSEAIVEASKVYNKLTAKSAPVEHTRKLISSLNKSGAKGEQAVASLQATTLLDLIDAGFSTESRQISGVKIFNPATFKRRLNTIGQDKINAIFANNPTVIRQLGNIDRIAADLIPPSSASPKVQSAAMRDLINRIGFTAITSKVPGGAFLLGVLKGTAAPVKKGAQVSKAMRPKVDVKDIRSMLERTFPGIASAIGIPMTMENNND